MKRAYTISSEATKMKPARQLIQLCIWKGGLGILDIDTLC